MFAAPSSTMTGQKGRKNELTKMTKRPSATFQWTGLFSYYLWRFICRIFKCYRFNHTLFEFVHLISNLKCVGWQNSSSKFLSCSPKGLTCQCIHSLLLDVISEHDFKTSSNFACAVQTTNIKNHDRDRKLTIKGSSGLTAVTTSVF